MAVQPRPQLKDEEDQGIGLPFTVDQPRKSSLPRWVTVFGVIVYCAVFWLLIVELGAWVWNAFAK